jgi:hypothetical protein
VAYRRHIAALVYTGMCASWRGDRAARVGDVDSERCIIRISSPELSVRGHRRTDRAVPEESVPGEAPLIGALRRYAKDAARRQQPDELMFAGSGRRAH